MDTQLKTTVLAETLQQALRQRLSNRNRLLISTLLRERISTAHSQQLRKALAQHLYRIDS